MTRYTSEDKSLASRLRRAANNPSSLSRASRSSNVSSALASDDDYGRRLAHASNAYSDALSADRSATGQVRRFANSLRAPESRSTWSRLCSFLKPTRRSASRPRLSLRSSLSREHREMLSLGASGPVITELAEAGRFRTIDRVHGYLASLVDTGSSSPWSGRSSVSRLSQPSLAELPNSMGSSIGTIPPAYQSVESSPPAYIRKSIGPRSGPTLPSIASELDASSPSSPSTPSIERPPYALSSSISTSPTTSSGDPSSPPPLEAPVPRTISNRSSPPIFSRRGWSSMSPSRRSGTRRDIRRQVDQLTSSLNSAAWRTPSSSLVRAAAESTRSPRSTRDALYLARTSDALSRLRPSTLATLSKIRSAMTSPIASQGGSSFDMMSEFAQRGSVPAFYANKQKLEGVRRALKSLDPIELGELISDMRSLQENMLWEREQREWTSSLR